MMKACEQCHGDGILVRRIENMTPYCNVAGCTPVYDKRPRNSDERALAALGLHPMRIIAYKGMCHKCNGRGIFEWTRGKSLPPLMTRQDNG